MEEIQTFQPSDAELEILQILWEYQPASVRLVHEKICEQREVGYTTVLTVLQRMTKKKLVERIKEGKSHLYRAVPREEQIQQNLVQRLLKTAYKGSAMKLMMHALGQEEVSSEELDTLQQWLENKKQNPDG
ncbi:MAG: BlaI/MecI/CopY family transcriptional regulator [Bacteroidota bacterium]